MGKATSDKHVDNATKEKKKAIDDENVVPITIEIRKGGGFANDLRAFIVVKDGEDDDNKGNFHYSKNGNANWDTWNTRVHNAIAAGTALKVNLDRINDQTRRNNDSVKSKKRKDAHPYIHYETSKVAT